MAKLTGQKVKGCLKSSALTLATLAGVIGGVIFGMALRTREGKTVLKFVNCVICNSGAYSVKLIYIRNKCKVI